MIKKIRFGLIFSKIGVDMEEKKLKIIDLLAYAVGIPEIKYFNLESDELLDEKVEVLEQIKEGKTIGEIPKFYEVLEDLPKDGTMWEL